MNNENNKINPNYEQNHTSAVEENVLKNLSTSAEGGIWDNDHLPNSANLILNESINSNEAAENKSSLGPNEINTSSNLDNDLSPENDNMVNSQPDVTLPKTTVLLETEWGSKVYIVGTAHFSEESQEDVAKVIRAVQPNFVVLELCESRSYLLKWTEDELLKVAENMKFKMMNTTIRYYGLIQGAMYLLLVTLSAQITRELGMAPGGEFRRALQEASNVPDCVTILGDRPIDITIRRAFSSLSWWQSIKFAFYVMFSNLKIDEEEIEKCKNRDYLEAILLELGGEFPELKNVFVNERDLYLTYSLMNASLMPTNSERMGPKTVVGVVGMGHVPGIQQNWGKYDPAKIREVLEIPPPSRTSRILKFMTKASLLSLTIYGIHKFASRSHFYSSLFR